MYLGKFDRGLWVDTNHKRGRQDNGSGGNMGNQAFTQWNHLNHNKHLKTQTKKEKPTVPIICFPYFLPPPPLSSWFWSKHAWVNPRPSKASGWRKFIHIGILNVMHLFLVLKRLFWWWQKDNCNLWVHKCTNNVQHKTS